MSVTALGTIFNNVSLSKTVGFKAFNNLPGVSISNFNLPSDDPAGGIDIETDVNIPSSARQYCTCHYFSTYPTLISEIGIELGVVTFQSFYGQTLVGRESIALRSYVLIVIYLKALIAQNLSLAPQSVTVSQLSGRIIPQSGADLNNIGQLFSNFLAGQNSSLVAKGNSVTPPGASEPVTWLSEAFQTLELPVTLPGRQFNIIQSIEINDLSITILSQGQAFAPPASSKDTLAQYKNPFGFALQVIAAGETLILASQGTDIAQVRLFYHLFEVTDMRPL